MNTSNREERNNLNKEYKKIVSQKQRVDYSKIATLFSFNIENIDKLFTKKYTINVKIKEKIDNELMNKIMNIISKCENSNIKVNINKNNEKKLKKGA